MKLFYLEIEVQNLEIGGARVMCRRVIIKSNDFTVFKIFKMTIFLYTIWRLSEFYDFLALIISKLMLQVVFLIYTEVLHLGSKPSEGKVLEDFKGKVVTRILRLWRKFKGYDGELKQSFTGRQMMHNLVRRTPPWKN